MIKLLLFAFFSRKPPTKLLSHYIKSFYPNTPEAATGRVLWKKMFLKILQNSQENSCVGVSLLIKLLDSDLQLYLKRDSEADAFLWILRNF